MRCVDLGGGAERTQTYHDLPAGRWWLLLDSTFERLLTFSVEVLPPTPPPAGDTCASPLVLAPGSPASGTFAGMSDDLWLWLMERGWREVIFKPDRRRYRDVSPSGITALFDAPPEEREKVLSKAVARATTRPTLAGIGTARRGK